jgi:hypothetical protein
MMDKFRIVVSGNIFEGFRFFGPFEDFDDACLFGEGVSETEWYVASLESPVDVFDNAKNYGYYWSDAAKEIVEEMRKKNEL